MRVLNPYVAMKFEFQKLLKKAWNFCPICILATPFKFNTPPMEDFWKKCTTLVKWWSGLSQSGKSLSRSAKWGYQHISPVIYVFLKSSMGACGNQTGLLNCDIDAVRR